MARSPIIRFVFAGILIVAVVVITFLYGNAERARQERQSEAVKQEQARRASEQKRAAQKDQAKKNEAGQDVSSGDNSDNASSSDSLSTTTAATPTTDTSTPVTASSIPQTGSDPLSYYLGSVTLAGLTYIYYRKKHNYIKTWLLGAFTAWIKSGILYRKSRAFRGIVIYSETRRLLTCQRMQLRL